MQKHTRPINVKELLRKEEAELINFNLEVQRGSVWNKKQKGMLIHSLICDYAIPPLYFVDNNDKIINVLDGQQRMRAIIEYANNEFSIPLNVHNYYDDITETTIEIEGKIFNELNEEIKDIFNSKNIASYTFKEITEIEIEEMFKRLNSGTALRKIEYTRVAIGHDMRSFLTEISNMDFFKTSINITDKARNRFMDQEIILQIITLLKNENNNLSGAKLLKLAEELNENGIDEEVRQAIINTSNYLFNVFPEKEKYLKKVHIPIIFKLANQAIKDNIDVMTFFDLIDRFFENIPDAYKEACQAGSAKAENVNKRLEILTEQFNKFLEFAHKEDIKSDIGMKIGKDSIIRKIEKPDELEIEEEIEALEQYPDAMQDYHASDDITAAYQEQAVGAM